MHKNYEFKEQAITNIIKRDLLKQTELIIYCSNFISLNLIIRNNKHSPKSSQNQTKIRIFISHEQHLKNS